MCMEPFAPGQRWAYRTRPGEEGSTLVVLRRELLGGEQPALHIQLQGLRLKNPMTAGGVQTALGHLPMSEEAVRASVTELLETGVQADDGGGYAQWREAHERGEAGVFTLMVAEVVQALEEAVNAPPPNVFGKSSFK